MSNRLELNKDGCMVRRIEPVTDVNLEPLVARSLLVENLPELLASSQTLSNLFNHFGQVIAVNVYHPAQPKKTGAGNSYNSNMSIMQTPYAVVLFANQQDADRSVVMMNEEHEKRFGLRVSKLPAPKLPTLNNSGKKFVRISLVVQDDGHVSVEFVMMQGQQFSTSQANIMSPRNNVMMPARKQVTLPMTHNIPSLPLQQHPLTDTAQLSSMLHNAPSFFPQGNMFMQPQNQAFSQPQPNMLLEGIGNLGFSHDTINGFPHDAVHGFPTTRQPYRQTSNQFLMQHQQQQVQATSRSLSAHVWSQNQMPSLQGQLLPSQPSIGTLSPLSTVRRSTSAGSSGSSASTLPTPSSTLPPIENKPHLFNRNSSATDRDAFKEMLNAWGVAEGGGQNGGNTSPGPSPWTTVPSGFQSVQARNQRQQGRRDYASWAAATPEMRSAAQAKYSPPQDDRRSLSSSSTSWVPQASPAASGQLPQPQATRPTFASRGDSAEAQVKIAKTPDGTKGFAAGRGRAVVPSY
eukprot:TRINITY_DN4470_c0_g1_i7.p1 TRINITY_DN4470_c0_g1~~TRINITY_DN4470_c0_g1_i7.p1  ORF type:complete len:517 (-),score=65.11 TRINITY_DN4470_c0_g1_i7:2435-3985(-)